MAGPVHLGLMRIPFGAFPASCVAAVALTMVSGQPARAHERFPAVGALAFPPDEAQHVVARTSFGLLVRDDGGERWSWICQPAMHARERDDASVAMATDGGLVAAQIAGLARSEDGGCTWTFPDARLSDVFVTDLAVHAGDPDVMWAATGTSKQANSVYRSDDGGRTWKRLPLQAEDIRLNRIEVAASDADVLYASGNRPAGAAEASAAGFLFRSDDGGDSWRRRNVELGAQGFEAELLAVDPIQPDRLYARVVRSAADALMLSEDGGAHWRELQELPGPLRAVVVAEDGRVWGGGPSAGLWHGRVGRPLRQVDDKLEVECLYRRANTLWLCDAGLLSGFQVGRSEDGGHSFEPFLHFSQVTGPRSCADTSPVARQCGSIWEDRREELTLFGPQPGTIYRTDIPAKAQTDDGCAIAGITTASGSWMWLALLAAWVRGRRRRRGLQLDPRSAGTYVDSSAA